MKHPLRAAQWIECQFVAAVAAIWPEFEWQRLGNGEGENLRAPKKLPPGLMWYKILIQRENFRWRCMYNNDELKLETIRITSTKPQHFGLFQRWSYWPSCR